MLFEIDECGTPANDHYMYYCWRQTVQVYIVSILSSSVPKGIGVPKVRSLGCVLD